MKNAYLSPFLILSHRYTIRLVDLWTLKYFLYESTVADRGYIKVKLPLLIYSSINSTTTSYSSRLNYLQSFSLAISFTARILTGLELLPRVCLNDEIFSD
jgi:hypothetical protein